MLRTIALLLALVFVHAAQAQTASPPTPRPPSVKPAHTKPASPKPETGVTSPEPATAGQHGACIGVIPHIGDRFVVQNVGLTVFGNELSEVPIESWGLDDLVVARVRAAAGSHVAVRRIAYSASAFNPFDHPPSQFFRNAETDLKGVVQTIARGAGCERYVVVIRGQVQYSNTNQMLKGIGIVHSGTVLYNKTYLFALSGIFVFDGHTFEILNKGVGETGDSPLSKLLGLGTSVLRGPSREIKDFPWPPPPDKVAGLRDAARGLLAESLDRTLPGLLARQ